MWHSRIQILVSRRVPLTSVPWDLDLCSPFWRIYVNDRSGAIITHHEKDIPLKAGEIWIIPAWVRFQTRCDRAVTQDYIHFHFAGMPSHLLQQVFNRPLSLKDMTSLAAVITPWREGFSSEASFSHLCWAGAVVHAVMALALAEWNRDREDDYWKILTETQEIQAALDHIEKNPAPPPTNSELSRLCGWSEDHFIRKFRDILGMTPAEYGREHRVALAAEWLSGTSRTMEDIAEATGFTDRFHFSRVFRARFGMPPARYRRMHRMEY